MNSKLQLVVLNSGVISLESNVSHDVNSFLIPTATNHVACVIVLPRALCRSEFKPRHMVFVFSFFFHLLLPWPWRRRQCRFTCSCTLSAWIADDASRSSKKISASRRQQQFKGFSKKISANIFPFQCIKRLAQNLVLKSASSHANAD